MIQQCQYISFFAERVQKWNKSYRWNARFQPVTPGCGGLRIMGPLVGSIWGPKVPWKRTLLLGRTESPPKSLREPGTIGVHVRWFPVRLWPDTSAKKLHSADSISLTSFSPVALPGNLCHSPQSHNILVIYVSELILSNYIGHMSWIIDVTQSSTRPQ